MGNGMGPIEAQILNEINKEEYYNELKSTCGNNGTINGSSLYNFQETDYFGFSSKMQREYTAKMKDHKRRVELERKKKEKEKFIAELIAIDKTIKSAKEEEKKKLEEEKAEKIKQYLEHSS